MHTGSYIDGKWQHPKSERLVRNVNPADTGDVLAEFPAATTADVERAIAAMLGLSIVLLTFALWRLRRDAPKRTWG